MNIKSLESKKVNNGSDLTIRHPVTGEKTDIVITLLSADSQKYQNGLNRLADKRSRMLLKGKRRNLSIAELRTENIELYAECTLGWKNISFDKTPFEYSRENAVALYTDFPWIFEQVEEFVEDRANFL